eukprot:Opistho-2@15654
MPTFSLKTGVGLAVVLLGLGLTAHFIIVQKRTEELTAQLIGEGSNVQDPNENPEISELLAQGHLIPPMLESLLRIEWRYSMARIKRPTILMRGVNWVIGRDEETYGKATRSNNVRIVRSGSLSSVAGVLCVGIGDLDEECVSANRYQSMTAFQRISRLHGLRQILWTKDGFCNTINYALSGFKDNFKGLVMQPFTFPCFTLPDQYRALETYANAKQAETPVGETLKWIVKPTDRGAGIGIYVVDSLQPLDELRKEGAFLIVQPYMNDPYLIDGYKFDLRTYVLVTSISPLRIYMYKEGLVRFASSKYDANATRGGDPTQFLTNTSINKKFKDVNELVWNFEKFKNYLTKVGEDPDEIYRRIYEAVVKVFISAEPAFRRHFQTMGKGYTCTQCYQLMGVDVIFDELLRPKVIEVNGSPDMHLSHQDGSTYDSTKVGMMTNVIAMNYGRSNKLANTVYREVRDLGMFRASQKECQKAKPFSFEFTLAQWNHARYADSWDESQSDVFFAGSSRRFDDNAQVQDESADSELGSDNVAAKAAAPADINAAEYWQCVDDAEINLVLTTRRELEKAGGFVRIYPSRLTGNSASVVSLLSHVALKLPQGTKGTYYYHPVQMAMIGAQERVAQRLADVENLRAEQAFAAAEAKSVRAATEVKLAK